MKVKRDLGNRVYGLPVRRLNVSVLVDKTDLKLVVDGLPSTSRLGGYNLEFYVGELAKVIEWATRGLGGDILLSSRGYWVSHDFDAQYHYDHMDEIPVLKGHEIPSRGRSKRKKPDLPKADVTISIGTREVRWIQELWRSQSLGSRQDCPVPHGLPVMIDGERMLIRWKKARGQILAPAVFLDDSPEEPKGPEVHLEVGELEDEDRGSGMVRCDDQGVHGEDDLLEEYLRDNRTIGDRI